MNSDRRTPLARARGLGSARTASHHWWAQRLTAIALIPLVVWFAISLVMLSGADYAVVRAWIGSPAGHGAADPDHRRRPASRPARHAGRDRGLRRHGDGWKLALIVIVQFIAVFFGLAAIVAILRIGFGG